MLVMLLQVAERLRGMTAEVAAMDSRRRRSGTCFCLG